MDDLIYNFLLKLGYPRASVVFDIDLLPPKTQSGSTLKVPTFIIVDPETANLLAVIEVVEALEIESLKQTAIETGAYASQLAGKFIQGFVIQVNSQGQFESELVQFYRIWPNSTLHSLSSRNFPDLDALRVSRMLAINATAAQPINPDTSAAESNRGSQSIDFEGFQNSTDYHPSNAGLYIPALILLVLIFADAVFTTFKGEPFLTVAQSILAFGAATLFTMPSAIRFFQR